MVLTIDELKKKYENIEDKIPTVWETYEMVGVDMTKDLQFTWNIIDAELIRVINLVSNRVPNLKITQHINNIYIPNITPE